ncbi:hypothetical protein EI94DRAFT_1826717 [Lactarius quietus]|nr:hypothetical protein EI94DRAFT_1826717 [Lactarius quietus]
MLTAGSSTGSRPRPRDSFQSSARRPCRACVYSRELLGQPVIRRSDIHSEDYGSLSATVQASKAAAGPAAWSAIKHFTPTSALLTRLVLPSTDDVSFSSSSFFRRVEEVSALNAARSEATLVTSLPSTPLPLRPPPRPPRRRPPPPIDEAFSMTPPVRLRHLQHAPQPKLSKKDLRKQILILLSDCKPWLRRWTLEIPTLLQRRLCASPSIKSGTRASLPDWSASQSADPAPGLARDPLTELLAVSDELKAMLPPFPSLPPTLHAFLDAPGASLHILEMEIHRESETFLGVPIPCIVVTSERDPLPPMDSLATPAAPLPRPPEVDMLAPPPATHRVRTDVENQLPDLVDSDQELGSPPASASSCEDAEDGSPTPWECGTSADSWEALSLATSPSTSGSCTKPVHQQCRNPRHSSGDTNARYFAVS